MPTGPRFGGEIVQYCARFRRGYPAAVVDRVVEAFGLTPDASPAACSPTLP